MKKIGLVLFAIAACILASGVSGLRSEGTKWPDELKGHIAAPDHHKVRFENEFVRVLEVLIPSGDTVPFHLHDLPTVMIILSPARAQIRNANGTLIQETAREEIGSDSHVNVSWLEPQVPGASVKNIDNVKFVGIRIELKIPFVQ